MSHNSVNVNYYLDECLDGVNGLHYLHASLFKLSHYMLDNDDDHGMGLVLNLLSQKLEENLKLLKELQEEVEKEE